MAFPYFSCWKGLSTESLSNKLVVLQKKHQLAQSFPLCDCPICLQPQLHTWSVLCPLSMWLLPGCAMSLGRQMSGLSLASREQLWSFPNISAKQMASFHLFPTIDLDLFFRVDTTIIYFSGASGKAQRWDTHLWLPSLSYTDWSHQLGDTISHSDSTTGGLSLPLHLAELGLPEQWEM